MLRVFLLHDGQTHRPTAMHREGFAVSLAHTPISTCASGKLLREPENFLRA